MSITSNPTNVYAPAIGVPGYPGGGFYGGATFGNTSASNYQVTQGVINQSDGTIQFQGMMTNEEIAYQNERALANRAFTRAINEAADAFNKTKNAQSTLQSATAQ